MNCHRQGVEAWHLAAETMRCGEAAGGSEQKLKKVDLTDLNLHPLCGAPFPLHQKQPYLGGFDMP